MRIQKTKNNIFLIIVIIFVVLLVGFVAIYAVKLNTASKTESQKPSTINYSPPTNEQINNGTSIKESSINNTSNSDSPASPAPQSGSSVSTVGVSMTYTNQNPDQYQIRFQIDADTSDGTCNLSLSKDGKVLNYSAGVQVNNKVASCQGFNVPIDANDLSQGTWQLTMDFSNTTLKGSLNTTVQVN